MFLIFAIVWSIFGSSEVQWWDSYWEKDGNKEYKKYVTKSTTREDRSSLENDFDLY